MKLTLNEWSVANQSYLHHPMNWRSARREKKNLNCWQKSLGNSKSQINSLTHTDIFLNEQLKTVKSCQISASVRVLMKWLLCSQNTLTITVESFLYIEIIFELKHIVFLMDWWSIYIEFMVKTVNFYKRSESIISDFYTCGLCNQFNSMVYA